MVLSRLLFLLSYSYSYSFFFTRRASSYPLPLPLPHFPLLFFSFIIPQMGRRKADSAFGQLATKRTRPPAPTFRVAKEPTTSVTTGSRTGRTSPVTVVRRVVRSQRGYLSEDKVHSNSKPPDDPPDDAPCTPPTQSDQHEQPADDGIVPDAPLFSSDLSFADDLDYGQVDDLAMDPASIQHPKQKRKQKNTTSVSLPLSLYLQIVTEKKKMKLTEWLEVRQEFLDELLRHDGHGDFHGRGPCTSCMISDGEYKCSDCYTGCLLRCRDCMVNSYRDHPLHRVEVSFHLYFYYKIYLNLIQQRWNGCFFETDTLQNLGLRFQLGHGGVSCPNPCPGPSDFCVFDVSGIHKVSVDFCDCRENGIIHPRTQLLRARWFPVTFNRPKTVFTFDCLDTFHELTLQGKTPLYDFYHMVSHKTDNLGLKKQTVSFSSYFDVLLFG